MKKVVKRILSMAMMSTLLVGWIGFNSFAAEMENVDVQTFSDNGGTGIEILEAELVEDVTWSSEIMPYTMLTQCRISVSGDSKGMHIDISTAAVGKASVIGVKDIKIEKKTWYGGWDTVAICSGREAKDRTSMGVSILYENAVKDATYKITCVHYADVDGYTECENDSGSFVFTY